MFQRCWFTTQKRIRFKEYGNDLFVIDTLDLHEMYIITGRVITGYKVGKDNNFSLIGKGNPQWPQVCVLSSYHIII